MITKDMIDRINQLAHKKKTEGLNESELLEQKKLYKSYLASIRKQVSSQLEQSGIQKKGEPHVCNDECCHHYHHQHTKEQ